MKNCRLKDCRLQISAVLTAAFCVWCLTAAYASQAKPPAPAKAAAPAAKATPESIANGETLYKRQCQTCHGATGVGDGPASKFLKGKLPNFTDKAAMAKIKDEDIRETITNGVKTEVGTMPPFKAKLKPEEIQDVMNFVHSFAK
jgi:mono/diheme cytochrome c family protein